MVSFEMCLPALQTAGISPVSGSRASLVSPDKLLRQPRDLMYIIASVKTTCPLQSPSKAPGARASVSEGRAIQPATVRVYQ